MTFKILVLGESDKDKLLLLKNPAITSIYKEKHLLSTGMYPCDYGTQIDGVKIGVQLVLISQSERFRSFYDVFFKGALAAIILYNGTSDEALKEVQKWVSIFRELRPDRWILLLEMNSEHQPLSQAAENEIAEYIKQLPAVFWKKIPSVTDPTLVEALDELAHKVYTYFPGYKRRSQINSDS